MSRPRPVMTSWWPRDDLWPLELSDSSDLRPELLPPTEPGQPRVIQMISDPVFVTGSHSFLRLLWEEPLNGSDCLSLYFLNYCILTVFTAPLPAIVTDTHWDGCHLHWAQKVGSCLSLNCHSSKCAVTLYIRWWPLSLPPSPDSALTLHTAAQAAGSGAFLSSLIETFIKQRMFVVWCWASKSRRCIRLVTFFHLCLKLNTL